MTASTTGLAAGTYTANVTVAAPGVAGAPATIPVTLTVTAPAPPALAVAPASLSFAATVGGSAPAAKTLAVTNAGSGALSYTAVRRRGVARRVAGVGERAGHADGDRLAGRAGRRHVHRRR